MTTSTYIGQKGYTLLKSQCSREQEITIIKQLTVSPIVSVGIPIKYNVFMESNNKYYVPRFYGIKTFGEPIEYKIPPGDDIQLTFNGELMDMQKEAVRCYMDALHPINGGGGLLEIYCGGGKTCTALYICFKLKKKTLIIVHKEFLLNQWVERIQQFLPNAKIGKIQGKMINIDGCDIVIAMLQSISMKSYDIDLFKSFGLTIIDEVHHISSEVFSKALSKIVTKYMLGLSATMNRLDGTTYVFKMFLGEVVFKAIRSDNNPVSIRGIHYSHIDEDYNKVIVDYKGKIQFSSMISKLCLFKPRNDFIINLIIDMFNENPLQQIMVLSHNRNILEYIQTEIESRINVGFYVGGMKENELKKSESCQLVLATYSMAAEALDIKTLTTLIMATPKINVEQSIGRILRVKHNEPIVVDIIDNHKLFKNQWTKRKKYYITQKYNIFEVKYSNYSACYFKNVSSNKLIPGKNDSEEENDDIIFNKLLIPFTKH
jgi:superfamily II DNA or RNA helicase